MPPSGLNHLFFGKIRLNDKKAAKISSIDGIYN